MTGGLDYPIAEKSPDRVKTPTGKSLSDVTVDKVLNGEISAADLAITPEALLMQAEIARASGRAALAANFERAAELVGVPQEILLRTYEMLRPGRAPDRTSMLEQASHLRRSFGAHRIAALIEEAADVYERRGIFAKRF